MPRPDLAKLGVSYRRIPLLAIGRHIYCDSQLILQVLQDRFPLKGTALSSSDLAVQKLFQHWNIDEVFMHAVGCIPFERSALATDPAFVADRTEGLGRAFNIEEIIKGRPESYAYVRSSFDLLETFLKDGRDWFLGGTGPSVVDIDAGFVAQWVVLDPLMEGSIPDEYLSEKLFPKTYAWVHRFREAVTQAGSQAFQPTLLSGPEVYEKITTAPEDKPLGASQGPDPLGLDIGQMVEVWPTDYASNHHDRGRLVMLTINEVCIRNAQNILVHLPRWNYRVQAVEEEASALLQPMSQETGSGSDQLYQMVYHPMSPYSRKVYMVALEMGLQDRIELQTVVVAPIKYPGWSDDNDRVARSNPLAKIPTLVVDKDGDGIYDSRNICDFLEDEALTKKRSDHKSRNWRLKTLHACADGMLDAQVLIVYERKIRAENNVEFQPWIIGQQEKILRGFDQLEYEVGRGTLRPPTKGTPATAAEVAVAACVGFMDIVGFEWREGRSRLAEWFQFWRERDSFVKTRPDVDWNTGEMSDIGFAREALAGKKG